MAINFNFAEKGGIEIDGLRWDAYQGCVYGNPPFDGQHEEGIINTIKDTMVHQAEKASEKRKSFRAVFFLPLQAKRLKERLSHPNATLIMKFPNDSVSFILPDNYWHEGNRKAGCYVKKQTPIIWYSSCTKENKRRN